MTAKRRFVIGAESDAELYRFGVEPEPWDARRGRHRHDQLHQRHHGPAQGRAAHPPQHLAQRHHLRLADGRQRPRRLPAHAAAVPLQRLGHAVRRHGHGRPPHRAAQGRRRRDPAPRRAPRRHPAVRRAGGGGHDPRRRRDVGRPDPRPRPGAHGRRRRTAADPHDRADGDRAGLGVHPDLRAHRDRAAAHDEPAPGRVRRPVAGRPGREARAGPARRRSASRSQVDPTGEVLARGNVVMDGYWNQPDATADAHRRRLVPHRRRRHRSTTTTTSRSPTARRT